MAVVGPIAAAWSPLPQVGADCTPKHFNDSHKAGCASFCKFSDCDRWCKCSTCQHCNAPSRIIATPSSERQAASKSPLYPPCSGSVAECCANTRCVLSYRWSPTGFGSRVIVLLHKLLVPIFPFSAHRGLPPGTLEMDDANFWYRCSPTQGFGCYFRPIRSCAQTLGRPLPTCTADELSTARSVLGQGSDDRGVRSNFLVRVRSALRGVWRYNEETTAFLEDAMHDLQLDSSTHITVHIRRGDALSREAMSLHDLAHRVQQLVCYAAGNVGCDAGHLNWHATRLGQLRVHVMSDDSQAADRFFKLLHVPDSSRVVVKGERSAKLESGFQTCLSPQRFGVGPCNCSGPAPKNTSKKAQDVIWRARCLVGGKVIQAPLEYSEVRQLMRALLIDLEIASRARLFIGACTSNVGHLVQLLRTQPSHTAMCLEKGSASAPELFSGDVNCRPCRTPEPVFISCANTTVCADRDANQAGRWYAGSGWISSSPELAYEDDDYREARRAHWEDSGPNTLTAVCTVVAVAALALAALWSILI